MTAPISSLSLILEALGSMSTAAALADRTPLKARVLEMVNMTTARLSVLGLTVDVETPIPLTSGMLLKLRIEQLGGQIRLVLQPTSSGEIARPLPPGTSGNPPMTNSTVTADARAVIGKIMADAHLDGHTKPQVSRNYVEELFKDAAAFSDGRSDGTVYPGSPNLKGNHNHLDISRASTADATDQGMHPSTEGMRGASQYIILPHEGSKLLALYVNREDDRQRSAGSDEFVSPVWTVNFSFSTPDHGEVHTFIRHGSAGTSVEFRTDLREAAAVLKRDLHELRDTLTAAAIDVEELCVVTRQREEVDESDSARME